MALLPRWEEKDLLGYFTQALQSNVAEDKENGIWIEESHGRSKYGTTQYYLNKHLGQGWVVTWKYKAYTDREAVRLANEYMAGRNFKGCKSRKTSDGIIMHIYETWPELANQYHRSEFWKFVMEVTYHDRDINTFPEWIQEHPELEKLKG